MSHRDRNIWSLFMKDSCRILKLELGQTFSSTDLEHNHKVWALLASQIANYKVVEMSVHNKTY